MIFSDRKIEGEYSDFHLTSLLFGLIGNIINQFILLFINNITVNQVKKTLTKTKDASVIRIGTNWQILLCKSNNAF